MITRIEINGNVYIIMVGHGGMSWWKENGPHEPTTWGDINLLSGVPQNEVSRG